MTKLHNPYWNNRLPRHFQYSKRNTPKIKRTLTTNNLDNDLNKTNDSFSGVLKMGLIANLKKDILKWLKPEPVPEAHYKVLYLITFFVGLYFLVALFGMLTLKLLLKYLNLYGLIETYNEMVWLFYGVILGISFAFFGQSFPPSDKKEFSFDILYNSFKHQFKYFLYFILAIVFWSGLILLILKFFVSVQ